MKRIVSCLLVPLMALSTLIPTRVLGQIDPSIPNVIPPSPDAASLGKFAATPVSTYNGVPQITVPLYDITVNGLHVPISLSYHAGGIKVAEVASSVGLGWALNAGGVITRSIQGLPDESTYGFINASPHIPNSSSCLTGNDARNFLLSLQNGHADTEPDIFYFNFNGNAGKFLYDSAGNIHISPYSKIVIQPSSAGFFRGWKITTEDGLVYIFNQMETTTDTKSATPSLPLFVSAWYLTEIDFPNSNQKITFNYTSAGEWYMNPDVEISRYGGLSCTVPGEYTPVTYSTNPSDIITSNTTVQTATLSSITFPNGAITFNPGNYRYDVQGGRVLDNIAVTANGSPVKNFKLHYKYFAASPGLQTDDGLATSNTAPSSILRLCLTDVAEYDKNNVLSKPPYSFTYYSFANQGWLPDRVYSKALDHWGFYNGQVNNTTLIPPHLSLTTGQAVGGGNRLPSQEYAKVGTLTQITYPTGGYTQFQFEQNDCVSSYLPNTLANISANYSIGQCHAGGATQFTIADQITGSGTITMTLSGTLNNFTSTSCTGNSSNIVPISSDPSTYIYFEIVNITNPANPQVAYQPAIAMSLPQSQSTSSVTVTLPNGTYNIQAVKGYSYTPVGNSDANFSQVALLQMTGYYYLQGPQQVGGLRIKQMTDFDPVANKTLTKTYDYTLNGQSTGIVSSIPSYGHLDWYSVTTQCYASTPMEVWESFSQAPLDLQQGGFSGYSKVTEYREAVQGSISTSGKTEYYYSNPSDLAGIAIQYPGTEMMALEVCYKENLQAAGSNSYPFAPTIALDWEKGLLQEKIDYKTNATGTGYIKVKDEVNTYKTDYLGSDPRFSNGTTDVHAGRIGFTGYLSPYIYFQYYYIPSRVSKLIETDEYNYDDAGVGVVTGKKQFYYDNPAHFQLSRSVAWRSDGNPVTTQYLYSPDYTDQTGFIGGMKTANIIDKPVETVSYLTHLPDGAISVLKATTTIYKQNQSIGLPDSVKILENPNPLPLAQFRFSNQQSAGVLPQATVGVTFSADPQYPSIPHALLKFDANGNMSQSQLHSDKKETYIWDYQSSLLIAHVINGDSASVAYTSFEADGTGNWTLGSTARTTPGVTGNNAYTLNSDIYSPPLNASSTYIVSYWTQNSTAFPIAGTVAGYPLKGKTVTINGKSWTYFEHKITGQATIGLAGTGIIDELRLYPAGAQMVSYTYTPLVGMTSQDDVSGKITYYEYDVFGRLKDIKDRDGNIIKTYDYHYLGQ